jgi:apolipoprotein N-acyltransferase
VSGAPPARRLPFLAAYAVATFLAFPHPLPFAGGAVLDLGIAVSFAVPAFLVVGLRGLAPRPAALRAFGFTVLAHGLVLHFIYVVTVRYGHAPVAIGVLAPFALATYAGLLGALFGAGFAWLAARGGANAWTVALLWTVVDHLRSMFLTGWPWATLGYAQHENPALLGLAPWTGVYGLSFAVVLGGVALLDAGEALARRSRPPTGALAALAFVVALHGFGLATRIGPDAEGAPGQTIRIAAVQGNIDQGVKWNAAWIERTLTIYEDLSREAAARGARIVVWPETAVPGTVEADARLRQRIEALSRETGASFVVGSVGIDLDREGRVSSFYDSAFLVEPEAGVVARYDKSHLVPFGEYVPLRGLLGRFLGAVASGIARGDVTPGSGPRALSLRVSTSAENSLERADGDAERASPVVRIGVPICYELLFPDLVRRFVKDGGGVLLGITNDAWYGKTGAPYQFLAITAMRAAEGGVHLVRAANTGVSAWIDAGGRVREQTTIFEPGLVVVNVPLPRPSDAEHATTFYVRHGDVFANACWLAFAAVVLVASRSARHRAAERTQQETRKP